MRAYAFAFTVVLYLGAATEGSRAQYISEFPISRNGGYDIGAGPDGNVWLPAGQSLFRITPAAVFTEFPVAVSKITAGPDGELWFTRTSAKTVSQITTAGVLTTFSVSPPENSAVNDIAAGPDGNVWLAAGERIYRITPASSITAFQVPSDLRSSEITAGPDGNMWFTSDNIWDREKIIRITPAGVITGEFNLPTRLPGISDITAGPDGNLWFSERGLHKIGRMTPAGFVTEFSLPSADWRPWSVTTGPDGNIWFVEKGPSDGFVKINGVHVAQYKDDKIGRVTLSVPGLQAGAVFSSVQADSRSFLRFYNSDTSAGTVTVSLADYQTGASLATWTSPSIIYNTGLTSQDVTLGICDARDGSQLGTYSTASIPVNGQAIVSVADLEAGAQITPTEGMFHYVIKAEGAFTGFLQHLVDNQQAGVVTDLTTTCALDGQAETESSAMLRAGAVYSTAQADSQSFMRFYNSGSAAGTVTVTLSTSTDAEVIGQWTSPAIEPGALSQVSITTVEEEIGTGFERPEYYSIEIEPQMSGHFQHVLWRSADGTLTNLSTCDSGIMAVSGQMAGIHTSILDSGYPSTVVIHNTGTFSASATLGVYDARDGTQLRTYTSGFIPSNGQEIVTVPAMEAAAGITPASDTAASSPRMAGSKVSKTIWSWPTPFQCTRCRAANSIIPIVVVPRLEGRSLSSELLYTALTRTPQHCTLLVQRDVSTLLSARRPENAQTGLINSSLFDGFFRPLPDELINRKGWYEESRIHEALSGDMVRSKSELVIANLLHEYDVPFAYEVLLRAPDGTMYLPDFTIQLARRNLVVGALGDDVFRFLPGAPGTKDHLVRQKLSGPLNRDLRRSAAKPGCRRQHIPALRSLKVPSWPSKSIMNNSGVQPTRPRTLRRSAFELCEIISCLSMKLGMRCERPTFD